MEHLVICLLQDNLSPLGPGWPRLSSPKRSSPKRGLFETMPKSNIARNVIAFNAAIHACKTAGQWQSALNLFKTITEAAC